MLKENKRIFGLDLLRATAIVFVLLAHTIVIIKTNQLTTIIRNYTGVLGVELFFVLSGFLIGTIIIKTHNKQEITSFNSIRTFWIRRWFRTLPNYYLILIVTVLLYLVGGKFYILQNTKYLLYPFFLQNSAFPIDDFFGTSWSICIEEWFYLTFPLILFFLQFSFKQKKNSLLATILVLIFLPLAGRIFLAINSNLGWDSGFRKIMLIRLDSIGFGVLAAYVNCYYKQLWDSKRVFFFTLGLISLIPLLIVFHFEFVQPIRSEGFFLKTFFFSFIGLSIALILPLLCTIKAEKHPGFVHAVNFISLISYSLYLLHPIVISLTFHVFKGFNTTVQFVLIWAISIFGSYIQYNFFEKRITELREKFGEKRFKISV